MNLHLEPHEARELGWSISLLAEWLRRADDNLLDELADFGFGLRTDPRAHLAALIDQVEIHAATLGQRPPILTGGTP